MDKLLAGDIGGTKTKLALFERHDASLSVIHEKTYLSADAAQFDMVIDHFLNECREKPSAACFGVAGPVENGVCKTTNLPWLLDEKQLSLKIPKVSLLNDLQATALGLLRLPAEDLVELNPCAQKMDGNIAVLAAGTGLGEAMLYWDGQKHLAIATEGGHADFAPNDAQQDALLSTLRKKFKGPVSYEQILSGSGLFELYQYLRDSGFAPESSTMQAHLKQAGDPARWITASALEQGDPLCKETLKLFARIYGAEAGNMAFKTLARGGVMIGGGIAPKLLAALSDGEFLNSFANKAHFSDWLKGLSIKVSLNPDAALLGAAYHAADL